MNFEMNLLPLIYETVLDDSMWDMVLEQGAKFVGAFSGCVLFFRAPAHAPVAYAAPAIRSAVDHWIDAGLWQAGTMAKKLAYAASDRARPVDKLDILTRDEWMEDPSSDLFRRADIEHQIIAPIPAGEGLAIFAFERLRRDGRFDAESYARIDQLVPHLARAVRIASRLNVEKARGMTQSLQTVGVAAAALSAHGRVLAVNDLFERRRDFFLGTAFDGLAIADPAANQEFQAGLRSVALDGLPRSVAVPAQESRRAFILQIVPLRSERDVRHADADVLVAAVELDAHRNTPDCSLLTALFDLTPAEARFAAALSRGRPIAECARDLGLTEKTGRTYLERIYAKTGKRRQTDLVTMLRDVSAPQVQD